MNEHNDLIALLHYVDAENENNFKDACRRLAKLGIKTLILYVLV